MNESQTEEDTDSAVQILKGPPLDALGILHAEGWGPHEVEVRRKSVKFVYNTYER